MASLSYMLLAAVALTLMSTAVQAIGLALPTFEVVFFRSAVHLVFILPFLLKSQRPKLSSTVGVLTLRGALGFIGIVCFFASLRSLPLGVASLLAWSSPLFTVVFAVLFLKERLTIPMGFALVLSTLGLFFLSAPLIEAKTLSWVAIAISLAGAAASGLAYLALKIKTHKVSNSWIAFFFSGTALLGALPETARTFVLPSSHPAVLLLLTGLGAAIYQFAIAEAYRKGDASHVAPLGLMVPVMCSLSDFFFTHRWLKAEQNGGALLLVLGIGMSAFLLSAKPKSERGRNALLHEARSS